MTSRYYEIRDVDGVALKNVLQGSAITGVDITPLTQIANAGGSVIDPPTLVTQLATHATLCNPNDAPWDGTGDASIVAALKAVWTQLRRGSPTGGGLTPKGVRQARITTAGGLATLTGAALPANATVVSIQAETGDIRMRDDGTAPTATMGMLVRQDSVWSCGGDLAAVRLAPTGTAPVTVNFAFYG